MTELSDKIKTIDALSEIIARFKQEGKKVVLCHGIFDLIHPGHIRHLEAARRQGDLLLVTVTPDRYVNRGPERPVFTQTLRAESLAALQCVDFVAVNLWPTAVEAIHKLKPDIYVKGSDYIEQVSTEGTGISEEEEAVRQEGGRLVFTDDITFSSSSLLNRFFNVYPEGAQEYLRQFRQSHSADEIRARLENLRGLRVMVVGDTIIDEYHYCRTLGKSPKENLVPTQYISEEIFAGGAVAAANHLAGFCNDVHLVSCLGTQDSREEFIYSRLKPNVTVKFFYRDDGPTVTKRRFVDPAFTRKMFEVCFLNDTDLPSQVADQMCDYLKVAVPEYDVVVVADFGHGMVVPRMIDLLCDSTRFLAVNAQTNSANAGFNLVTKYPRADYVCIDEPEARLATHSRHGDLRELIDVIQRKLNCGKIAITRGIKGALVYGREEGFFEIPILSKHAVDTMGAGDAYLAVTSPCVASGMPIEEVGFVGNAVGALKVGIVGHRESVEKEPLLKFIATLMK